VSTVIIGVSKLALHILAESRTTSLTILLIIHVIDERCHVSKRNIY